ncbi:hypothetical protein [Micromonospora sediminicola]|uniref:hypothetical protein n=1 Tax=Micromonospora sediminicola TaxID=946078 RepID=UPI0037A0FABA
MTGGETERETRIRRVRDAVISAVTTAGITDADIDIAVEEGMAEGRRVNALRAGNVPAPRREASPARPVEAEPGSALAEFLKTTAAY